MAGKGGVGKTTLGATLGLAAARLGLDVTLIELEGHSTLGRSLGHGPLGYEPVSIEVDHADRGTTQSGSLGRLQARRITPDDALAEYLGDRGMRRVVSRLIRSGAIEVVSTAAPGIRDLLALGKIRQLEQARGEDLIVVDAPGSGHAITFLRAPAGLADASPTGPLREQSDLVLELLGDERRCQTMLVTLAEETPVNEVIETAYSLEDTVGVKLAPVVVNGRWPTINGLEEALGQAAVPSGKSKRRAPAWSAGHPAAVEAGRFRLEQCRQQYEECERLRSELPLPQIQLPHQFTTRLGRSHLGVLAEHLTQQLDELEAPQ